MVDRSWAVDGDMPASGGRHRREVVVNVLDDPALWGGPIQDERYLIDSPG
jgi:hypothetical protein